MDFKEKKKILYSRLKLLEKNFQFKKKYQRKFGLKYGGFRLTFEDSSELSLYISRFSKYHKKNCFSAESSFTIYDGAVVDMIKESLGNDLDKVDDFSEKVIYSSSKTAVPAIKEKFPNDYYKFVEGVDCEALSEQIVSDMEQYFFKYLYAFIDDYSKALDIILEEKPFDIVTIENPFLVSAALIKLTGRFEELDRLVKMAQEDKTFNDYHYNRHMGRDLVQYFQR